MSSNKKERQGYGLQLKRQAETKLKRKLREEHIKDQGGKCAKCQLPLDFERSALIHTKGTELTKANTAAVHAGCVR